MSVNWSALYEFYLGPNTKLPLDAASCQLIYQILQMRPSSWEFQVTILKRRFIFFVPPGFGPQNNAPTGISNFPRDYLIQ